MKKFAIDEEFLQQVESLQMLIKNNTSGLFGGNHKSRTYGSSCEFADYRDYVAGDDVTKIDWNAYARFEKLYLKLYNDERQMHTKIYLDASRSMAYGKGGKDVQALKIAATVAYLSVCEMDKVSVYTIQENGVREIIGGLLGKDNYITQIGKLNGIEFGGDCCITEAVLPSNVGYGDGLSVLISDFLTDNDYETAIDHLAGKKRDILCVQVLSKEESNPKLRGKMHLFDAESSKKEYRRNITREIAQAYRAAYEYATDRIRGYCASRGADYMLVSSEEPVTEIFFDKLVNMGVLK